MRGDRTLILGTNRGRRVRLEVSGDTLLWRGTENVATTIHEVKGAAWREQRISIAALVLAALALAWAQTQSPWPAACAIVVASVLGVRRMFRPQRTLSLSLADRVLRMHVR